MAELAPEKFELFVEGMKQLQRRGVLIPEGQEKNRQYLKDEVLKTMKTMFEAVDRNDPEATVTAALNIANSVYAVAYATGKIDTFVQKVIGLGTAND